MRVWEAVRLLTGPGGSIAIAISVGSGDESGGTFTVSAGDSSGESGGISLNVEFAYLLPTCFCLYGHSSGPRRPI